MDHAEAYNLAFEYVEVYRQILLVDPLYRLNILIVEDGPACLISKDQQGKCSWTASLNIKLHEDRDEIRLSVLEFLSEVIMNDFDFSEDPAVKLASEKAKCRLFNIFQSVIPDLDSEDDSET
jgi:hypothetical protein